MRLSSFQFSWVYIITLSLYTKFQVLGTYPWTKWHIHELNSRFINLPTTDRQYIDPFVKEFWGNSQNSCLEIVVYVFRTQKRGRVWFDFQWVKYSFLGSWWIVVHANAVVCTSVETYSVPSQYLRRTSFPSHLSIPPSLPSSSIRFLSHWFYFPMGTQTRLQSRSSNPSDLVRSTWFSGYRYGKAFRSTFHQCARS